MTRVEGEIGQHIFEFFLLCF